MKAVLIATDFSDASRNAALYGLELARAMKATAVLFHAYENPVFAPDAIIISSFGNMGKIAGEQLVKESNRIAAENSYPFETCCEEGSPAQAIMKKADEIDASLIITGFKIAGKTIRQIFGSTVTSLTKHSAKTVLIVPEQAKFSIPDSIVFANDLSVYTDIHVLDDLKAIAEHFKARLFVVKVVKNKSAGWHEAMTTPETLLMSVRKIDSEFDYPVGKDIVYTLNEFTEKHRVKMVAMMPHKHFWTDAFFGKRNTSAMVFHTKIPLLILPEKDYNDLFRQMKTDNKVPQGLLM
ncbi:MAG TPA: universal stress protein [Panacibacter sp.]|nr:universal stress protein [Panacibacter sp.]HNP43120.1 universal stress protein [Panacibacter sp.]